MVKRRRWGAALAAVMLTGVLPTLTAPSATAGGASGLRLIRTTDEVVERRSRSGYVNLDPRMLLAAMGGNFEIQASRPDYDTPVAVIWNMPGGGSVALPDDVIDGWSGLRRFLHVTVTDRDGVAHYDRWTSFCPNTWEKQRVGPDGPSFPEYPSYCGWNPFTLGMVYGIEQDWAASIGEGSYGALYARLEAGRYRMHVRVASKYVGLLDLDPVATSASVRLVVKGSHGRVAELAAPRSGTGQPTPGVPTVRAPDPAGVPDLQPLPSWGISTRHTRQGDFLSFGANVWVAGNGPLVVEGFRREGEDVMDAYQYFYEDGEPVGRERVGEMEFDDRDGHGHWHFKQFAGYQLLAEDKQTVVVSTKEAFCLVPTDAIDLTLPAADLRPGWVGLYTSCGGRNDLWIREVLPVGWGDTYYQYLPGQSFEITDVPNGVYYVKVVANPDRQLHELDYTNNVRLRKVIIRGSPGHRRVEVPPWHGIDTEAWLQRYGFGPFVG